MLISRFYDLKVSRNPPLKTKKREICEINGTDFSNCESTCDLTDVPGAIYDWKSAARAFDTIHDILRSLSLVESLLKGKNAPIWRQRMQRIWDCRELTG